MPQASAHPTDTKLPSSAEKYRVRPAMVVVAAVLHDPAAFTPTKVATMAPTACGSQIASMVISALSNMPTKKEIHWSLWGAENSSGYILFNRRCRYLVQTLVIGTPPITDAP